MTIAWPKSLRWNSLTRMARGVDSGVSSDVGDRFPHARSFAVPSGSWSELPDIMDWQPRRRADMHPDAPPRPPIVASRDLPALPQPRRPAPIKAGVQPPVVAAPVRTLISAAEARPMPRAPQPLSEAQLDAIHAILSGEDKEVEPPSQCDMPPAAGNDADIVDLSMADTNVTDDVPLYSLLERFEQQVERKIAIDASKKATAAETDEGLRPEVDAELRTALETLKALSQPGRKA